MINVTLKNIKLAFHPNTILTPAQKTKKKILDGFGAYCRTVTRNSIKQAKNRFHHADKGKPPLYHSGGNVNYKNTIFFLTDAAKGITIIGGVLLSGTAAHGDPVPGVLEHGGRAVGVKPKRSSTLGATHGLNVDVQPHPHTRPAFEKAVKKKLPSLIAGGIMREAR